MKVSSFQTFYILFCFFQPILDNAIRTMAYFNTVLHLGIHHQGHFGCPSLRWRSWEASRWVKLYIGHKKLIWCSVLYSCMKPYNLQHTIVPYLFTEMATKHCGGESVHCGISPAQLSRRGFLPRGESYDDVALLPEEEWSARNNRSPSESLPVRQRKQRGGCWCPS